MLKFIESLTNVINIILTLYGFYFLCYIVFALQKTHRCKKEAPKHRFAVVVAARNEEAVIKNLVESLRKQHYPDDLYDIYVVPNNCIDDTKGQAQKAGAHILECNFSVKSKGEVLRYAFNRLMSVRYNYDAFCVFDADNVVDPEFLSEMNNALCEGSEIAQGNRKAKNPYDTWMTACYHIYFTIISRFFNHTKANAGMTTYISGTGFMVSTKMLRKKGGWRTITMSEDTEFTLSCIVNQEDIAWVPEAITYDEQPLTLSQSIVQRSRWSVGSYQLLTLYFRKIADSIQYNWIQGVDSLVMLFAPFIQILAMFPFILTVLSCLLTKGYDWTSVSGWVMMLMPLFYSYAYTLTVSIAILKLNGSLNRRDLKGILSFWVFMTSWSVISLQSLFKKEEQWHEIKHHININADHLKTIH